MSDRRCYTVQHTTCKLTWAFVNWDCCAPSKRVGRSCKLPERIRVLLSLGAECRRPLVAAAWNSLPVRAATQSLSVVEKAAKRAHKRAKAKVMA